MKRPLKKQGLAVAFKKPEVGNSPMKRQLSLLFVLFVLLAVFTFQCTPASAGLANFTAPAEKELGQVYSFSVMVLDGGSNPMNDTPCQAYVTAPNGEIINYFKPDEDSKTLYTDQSGLLVYGFKLVNSIYQIENIYNFTVVCPSGSVMQPFLTLTQKTPNWFFNFLFFLKDNMPFIIAGLVVLFFIWELIRHSIGHKWANIIAAIVLMLLFAALVWTWVFR